MSLLGTWRRTRDRGGGPIAIRPLEAPVERLMSAGARGRNDRAGDDANPQAFAWFERLLLDLAFSTKDYRELPAREDVDAVYCAGHGSRACPRPSPSSCPVPRAGRDGAGHQARSGVARDADGHHHRLEPRGIQRQVVGPGVARRAGFRRRGREHHLPPQHHRGGRHGEAHGRRGRGAPPHPQIR